MTVTYDVKSSERNSDVVFNLLNRIHDAKLSGALLNNELSKLEMLIGSIFANQVTRGLKTEEEAEIFIGQIPNGEWNWSSYPHEDQKIAYKTIKQDVNAALLTRENLDIQSHPVMSAESYEKTFKKLG